MSVSVDLSLEDGVATRVLVAVDLMFSSGVISVLPLVRVTTVSRHVVLGIEEVTMMTIMVDVVDGRKVSLDRKVEVMMCI
jgi:hypothetical protein